MALMGLTVLAACESSGPIQAADSQLALNLDGSPWPTITRERTLDSRGDTEEWSWPNGGLYVTRSKQGRYIPEDFSDPEDLLSDIDSWGHDASRLDRRDIKIDENRIGEFQFATIAASGENCFFMLQPIPVRLTPGRQFPDSAESSDGFISMVHCARMGVMSQEKLELRGLEFSRGLSRTW